MTFSRHHVTCTLLLFLLSLVMIILAWRFVAEPGEAFGPRPLLSLDFGAHTEQYRLSLSIDKTTGHPWGYSGKYLAGHGHTYELSVPILGTVLYSVLKDLLELSTWRWIEYFMPFAFLPLILFWSARLFRLGPWTALLASFWGSMYTWLGYPTLFTIAGPVDKMLALAMAILAGLAAYDAWDRGGWRRGIIAVCLAVAAGYMHRSALLWLSLMLASGWILTIRRNPRILRSLAWTFLAVLMGVIASLPWLAPLLRFWGCMDPALHRSLSLTTSGIDTFFQHLFPSISHKGERITLWGTVAVQLPLWILGLGASIRNFNRDDLSKLTCMTLFGFLFFLLISRHIRYLQIFELITFFVPATFLLAIRCAAIANNLKNRKRVKWFIPAVAGFSLLFGLLLPSYQSLIEQLNIQPSTRIPPFLSTTARVINDHVSDDTRIAVDEAKNPFLVKDRLNMICPMAVLGPATAKSYLGYCNYGLQAKGALASFWDGRLLGLRVEDCDTESMHKRLLDYNVGWIVTFTPSFASRFSSMPSVLERVYQKDGIWLFRVQGNHSYFYQGSGEIQFLPGIIRLRHLKPDQGVVILKAHYVNGLRAFPPAKITSHPVYEDTAGFIRIENPPETLDLRMSLF